MHLPAREWDHSYLFKHHWSWTPRGQISKSLFLWEANNSYSQFPSSVELFKDKWQIWIEPESSQEFNQGQRSVSFPLGLITWERLIILTSETILTCCFQLCCVAYLNLLTGDMVANWYALVDTIPESKPENIGVCAIEREGGPRTLGNSKRTEISGLCFKMYSKRIIS